MTFRIAVQKHLRPNRSHGVEVEFLQKKHGGGHFEYFHWIFEAKICENYSSRIM